MAAIVLFGSAPTASQKVNADLALKGINLCKESPSELRPLCSRIYDHPNYISYVDHFPLYINAALNGPQEAKTLSPFFPVSMSTLPKFLSKPKIIFSFGEQKSADVLDQVKSRYNATETTARGKPAFTAVLSRDQVRSLVQDYSPVLSTEFSVSTLNLDAYMAYNRLWAVIRCILKVHQYPLVAGSGTNLSTFFEKTIQYEKSAFVGTTGAASDSVYLKSSTPRWIHCNLPTAIDAYRYYFSDKNHLPNDSGIIFPFEHLLASDDHEVLTLFFQRKGFFNLLGDSIDACIYVANTLQKAWKNLKMTLWGKELSHVLHGIMMAFDGGAGMKIILAPTGVYGGFILYGGYFKVCVGNITYVPQTFAEVQASFEIANPHAKALDDFLKMVTTCDDPMVRGTERAKITRMFHLGELVRRLGYNANDKNKMLDKAKLLSFPSDVYFPIQAQYISRVFNTIASGVGDELLPLHCSAVLEQDRSKRLLSAFGTMGPSFLIAGGRTMELTGNFSYKTKTGKGAVEVNVTRMFASVVPMVQCWKDFETMISEKHVITPAGTPLAHRASARSTIREFEGNLGTEVLASLRKVCQVAVSSTPTVGAQKRKRDDEEEEKAQKKAKASFEW